MAELQSRHLCFSRALLDLGLQTPSSFLQAWIGSWNGLQCTVQICPCAANCSNPRDAVRSYGFTAGQGFYPARTPAVVQSQLMKFK